MQFNSHSFDSISYQVIIPPQFTLKVEHSRIIPILIFQFQCPGVHTRSGMADLRSKLRSYFLPSGSSSNSRNVEEEETESIPQSKKPKRSFNLEWLCEFSWLSCVDGRMFCV